MNKNYKEKGSELIAKAMPKIDSVLEYVNFILEQPNEAIKSIPTILRAGLRGRMGVELTKQIGIAIEQGKINNPLLSEDLHERELFAEILDLYEHAGTDEQKLRIAGEIYVRAAQRGTTQQEMLQAKAFIKIISRLSGTQLHILLSIYRCYKKQNQLIKPVGMWLDMVAEESGYKFSQIIENEEQGLVETYVIGPRIGGDNSSISHRERFRLTPLGVALCDYIVQSKVEDEG